MPVTNKLPFKPGCALLLLLVLSACAALPAPVASPDPLATAAAQATAMIQQAQASALLQNAAAQATALLKIADTPTPQAVSAALASSTTLAPVQLAATRVPEADISVEVTRVSFAGEGAYIYVEFKAAPKTARNWMQGNVSVLDEASGILYNAIPVAPVIGPLIGRPKTAGQLGYVMLVNAPTPLPAGTLVTVRLGDYQKEHIKVQ